MEIRPGIHQISLPLVGNPLGCVNVYVVRADRGWILIDTGLNDDRSFETLREGLTAMGVRLADIRLIVVTHWHADHCGLAGRLQEASGAEVAIHEVEKEFFDSGYARSGALIRDMLKRFRRSGIPSRYLPDVDHLTARARSVAGTAMPDRGLRGGETIDTAAFALEVIWTPGHSPGHVCLYEPSNRLLFAGDHVLPGITPNISLHPAMEHNPLDDYVESLKRVLDLDVELVLPAHREIFTDLTGRVEELLAHHEHRKAEILTATRDGSKTAYQICSDITWMEGRIGWEEIGPRERPLAVAETVAHLEALRAARRIERTESEDVALYRAV